MTLLQINALTFSLPPNIFGRHIEELKKCRQKLEKIASTAGQGSKAFTIASKEIHDCLMSENDICEELTSPIKVRAFGVALLNYNFNVSSLSFREILQKINQIIQQPSALLLENLCQFYLRYYDRIIGREHLEEWLILTSKKRVQRLGKSAQSTVIPLIEFGPIRLAEQAIREQRDFDNLVHAYGLNQYVDGRFMEVAKYTYYVEQLKDIPVNSPHSILQEVQKKTVYESRFNEKYLLGHKILLIVITRAPHSSISQEWLNVILTIAGDPRVPKNNPKFIEWWNQIDESLQRKARGWLSKLDFKLFLEALKGHAETSKNYGLQRMFPSREVFLRGLEEAGLVTDTRLYLTVAAESYLRKTYKNSELPEYSIVKGDRCIIYINLNDTLHLIEGSHSCKLWIYKELHPSALVYDYSNKNVGSDRLTYGVESQMEKLGISPLEILTHDIYLKWQHSAIEQFKKNGIDISPEKLLTKSDYKEYRYKFGV